MRRGFVFVRKMDVFVLCALQDFYVCALYSKMRNADGNVRKAVSAPKPDEDNLTDCSDLYCQGSHASWKTLGEM